jgi:hypothetical protein
MPYLDEWSAFETDYSVSLSEAIQALLNASLQVPISGNARVCFTLFLWSLSGFYHSCVLYSDNDMDVHCRLILGR